MTDTRVVLAGLCVLAVASALVFWRGGQLERVVMTITVVCWAAAAIGQFATGSAVIPVVVCDMVFAVGLLALVLRHHRPWLYGLFAVEALRILLHALAFSTSPAAGYRLANNVLSTIGLTVLVAAALWPRRAAEQPGA